MDVREKFVKLIAKAKSMYADDYTDHTEDEYIAETLLDNGVTVQELDGCEHCKEDNDGCRTMFGAFSIANPFHGNEWTINTGHCKPRQIYYCPMCGRKLSEPPKGE